MRAKFSRPMKTALLLLAIAVIGFGGWAALLKGPACPNQKRKWVALGYPQTAATGEAITAFASKEQSLVELEDWAGELECSGDRQLLGRVLAQIGKTDDSLKLSSVFLGIADKGPKNSGAKSAAELQEIFSSPETQDSFAKPLTSKLIDEVKGSTKSFQKALYEIILESLSPETAAEFRSQTRLTELLRNVK